MSDFWQIFILIQLVIEFEQSLGILSASPSNVSVVVPPPKIVYLLKNKVTGLNKATKEIRRAQSSSRLHASSNRILPITTGIAIFHSKPSSFASGNANVPKIQTKKFSDPPVDGNWGNWGEFGPATKTCDEGFRTRVRECNNPPPRGKGKSCKGSDKDTLLFEFGRCILKEIDTEFKEFSMGMWKNEGGTAGLWKVVYERSKDATGDGYYLLADSTRRKREDTAIIISDLLAPAPKVNRACLKFRYLMPGSSGLLMVKIKRYSRQPKQIWEAYGNQGGQWVKERVTLKSSAKFQVLFVASFGTAGQSSMALDSIYVDNGPCKCQDEYNSCHEWATEGRCDSKNDDETYYWMTNNCKTSCKTCYCNNRAGLTNCRRWAKEGYCHSYLTWMSANCQLSCRHCSCKDHLEFSDCQARVSAYECESQPEWMAGKCKLSCGFCDCKNIATDEECYRRKTGGECESNPIYMNSHCKYMCGYCNCNDRHEKCSVWAAEGECKKNAFWMDVYCTLSCGKCS